MEKSSVKFNSLNIWLLAIYLFIPIICSAQNGIITGKIIQADTKTPVKASIFLGNSSYGTTSANDGSFTLSGLKAGQYTLVVTSLGYQEHTQTVLVNGEAVNLNIELSAKAIQLKEVSISTLSKADWKIYYEQFKELFIGTDKNAGNCKIINPDVLNINYHKATQQLIVSTDDFLIVENQALGYRVKFLIEEFKSDGIAHNTTYVGQPLFEELPGNESQKKKWIKNRSAAYYGSYKHFYRSLLSDSLAADGFEIHHLTRQPYPKTPITTTFKNASIREMKSAPDYYNEKLDKDQLKRRDILQTTNQPGIYALTFPDYLYVVYTKLREDVYSSNVYRPADMPNYEVTIVSLLNKPPYALFDTNGTIVSDPSPFYEGTWARARLSELLPVDYTPGK